MQGQENGVYPAHGKSDSASRQANAPQNSQAALPSLRLPKGGGAVRGMGEKFMTNPSTGTASLSVPLAVSPGRSGFTPTLSLSYDSGSGNGPFGLGWNLSLPSITRKTDKGLPRYRDDAESDTFLLSGAEDLVPTLAQQQNGSWQPDIGQVVEGPETYTVQRYRPRLEGLWARIERWRNQRTGDVHWRSISKENITTLYGRSAACRIADPADPTRIFSWLVEETYDDWGNAIVYEYKQEDTANVDTTLPQEAHRLVPGAGFANRYPKRIYYGNTQPFQRVNWLFTVVFDYGEHDADAPTLNEDVPWLCRQGAFSQYRAGFEVRTYRLCRRVLMFHQFAELGAQPCLVRSTDCTFQETPVVSFLIAVTQKGYVRDAAGSYQIPGISPLALPALEFGYTQAHPNTTFREVEAESVYNLPIGVDGARYQWIDLDSEGVPGVLTEQEGAWFYKRNLGEARFAPVEMVGVVPSSFTLSDRQRQIMDLAGDGQQYLVQFTEPLPGFYERTPDGAWGSFTPFAAVPHLDWNHPDVKLLDLTGDGRNDILFTADDAFVWYPSLARQGFGSPEALSRPNDEEKGPTLVFADAEKTLYLADMTGDGLTDLVRIRNGEVCYWPNLGYGRFGQKVTMGNAPQFDHLDQFDPQRLRLADLDGSGPTDLVYLGRETMALYVNEAGNRWSAPTMLEDVPPLDAGTSVQALDLWGNGTACLVWSSSLPEDAHHPLCYLDLMGSVKPHLLNVIHNNLGAETNIVYAPSTRFYLADRETGMPWVTRLPFPVHVIESVEMFDRITRTTLVTHYRYHHGYYDGAEREFRGFGCVEQWDTETFAAYRGAGRFRDVPGLDDVALHQPPVYTRTWFHTGAYIERDNIARHYTDEYYQGDVAAPLLPDTVLPSGLTEPEEREACRALKGALLRQEVYAQDDGPASAYPYRVTERSYALRLVQPRRDQPHAVFFSYLSESIDSHYERHPNDPRVTHEVTLEVDTFGNVLRSATVAYRRRAPVYPEQGRTWITLTENRVANRPSEATWYRLGVPIETRAFELTGPLPAQVPLSFDALLADADAAAEIAYEDAPDPAAHGWQKRVIEAVRYLYCKNDLTGALAFGDIESLALLYETYRLALMPGLVAQVFGNRVNANLLQQQGGYRDWDGSWWSPSGRSDYDVAHFYLPVAHTDPFGNSTTVAYDNYALLVTEIHDALPNPLTNILRAQNHYRTLQPWLLTDANANQSGVRFDALGRVTATAQMSKAGVNEGDVLDLATAEASNGDDPTTRIEYALLEWRDHGRPVSVRTLAREIHGDPNTRWQETFLYLDGSGHEIQRKLRAEPGGAPGRDADGQLKRNLDGSLVIEDANPRWAGTGRTIWNNKNNPVKKYEPFFSSTSAYEDEQDLAEWGVTPILRYDPPGRLIRTDLPSGAFLHTVFDAWQQTTYNENDTVLQSQWHADRQSANTSVEEQRADQLTAAHADTPEIAHLDALGRTFLTIADNGPGQQYATWHELDIEGNERALTDARGNRIQEQTFDLLGNRIHIVSLDSGTQQMLNDALGQPLLVWDDRGNRVRFRRDALRRQTHRYLRVDNGVEILLERWVYGETHAQATARNLRGLLYQSYDGAGVQTVERYDFKGNRIATNRRLATEFRQTVGWIALDALNDVAAIENAALAQLEDEVFTSQTDYDALNRLIRVLHPDNTDILPVYNEASLLKSLSVKVRGAAATPFIKDIVYNARGQRERLTYGSDVETQYRYDPFTFRLARMTTTRPNDGALLQDCQYTDDPVGNITEIRDGAQQDIYFQNAIISPDMRYEYDALSRLTVAEGREHIGQNAPPTDTDFQLQDLPHPNNPQAMRRYREVYVYDEVGNLRRVTHREGANTLWRRGYEYDANSNRLMASSLPGDDVDNGPYTGIYAYDNGGNMTAMPHLQHLTWNVDNRLQMVDLGGGGMAYYAYDATGERVRAVVERQAAGGNPGLREERIYLNGYEIFRRHTVGGDVQVERQTVHLMDDKKRIALIETLVRDNGQPVAAPAPAIRYQLDNHLRSCCLELAANGAVIGFEEYHPFGTTSYRSAAGAAEVSRKRYRFTGKERDAETGFTYHGARYYAPWLGRWTSPDPAGTVDGPNRYAYTQNNPIRHTDPTGTETLEQKIEKIESPIGWFFARTGYDLWNVASLGTLSKVEQQKNLGTLEGLGESTFTGARSFSNAASLGLQDRIYEAQIKEGPKGIVTGTVQAGADLLPIEETKVLVDPNTTAAQKWQAGGLGLAKTANLVGLGAGFAGKNPVVFGESAKVKFSYETIPGQKVGHNMGGIELPTDAPVTGSNTARAGQWFERVITGDGKEAGGVTLRAPGEVVQGETHFRTKIAEIEVPISRAQGALKAAQAQVGQTGTYNLVTCNCTTLATGVLGSAGVPIPALSPSSTFWLVKNLPFVPLALEGAGVTNATVQATKKEEKK